MQDSLHQKEQVTVSLECGHPYKNEGEWCELCQKFVPVAQGDSKAAQPQEHKE